MKKLGLGLVSVMLILLLMELVLRLTNYPYWGCEDVGDTSESKIGEFHQDLGWLYRPGVASLEDGINYTFSAEGYRSENVDSKTDPGKETVLIVGDSILFGHGVEFKDTFGAKLQKSLGEKYQVVNFAVQGYGLDQVYIRLTQLMERYKPKYVIVDLINDDSRNVNQDRRNMFACIKTSGTKPMFAVKNNKLELIYKPEKYGKYDNPRIALIVKRVLDGVRLRDENKWQLTNSIYSELRKYVNLKGATLLPINYFSDVRDAQKEDVASLVLISEEEMDGKLLADRFHPNKEGTSLMLDKFWDKNRTRFEIK